MTLVSVYIVEVTGKKTPTVTIDSKVAQEHAAIIMQGRVVEMPGSPWMIMEAIEVGGVGHREQGEEIARAKAGSFTKDMGDSSN